MATNVRTLDVTKEEAALLAGTEDDFIEYGKTSVKCPRCGGNLVMTDWDSSYTIGCEHNCVTIGFRGI